MFSRKALWKLKMIQGRSEKRIWLIFEWFILWIQGVLQSHLVKFRVAKVPPDLIKLRVYTLKFAKVLILKEVSASVGDNLDLQHRCKSQKDSNW